VIKMIFIPKEYEKFIGVPFLEGGRDFDGADCYGLSRLFKKDVFNIESPSFDADFNCEDVEQIHAIIEEHRASLWRKLSPGEHPKLGDDIYFYVGGIPSHIGIYIGRKTFIHANDGIIERRPDAIGHSCAQEYDTPFWSMSKIEGIYRYRDLEGVNV